MPLYAIGSSEVAELAMRSSSRTEFRSRLVRLIALELGENRVAIVDLRGAVSPCCMYGFELEGLEILAKELRHLRECKSRLMPCGEHDAGFVDAACIPESLLCRLAYMRALSSPNARSVNYLALWRAHSPEETALIISRMNQNFSDSQVGVLRTLYPTIVVSDRSFGVESETWGLGELDGRLTARQRTIVRGVAAGLSNRCIAQRCGISQHTVRNTLARLYEKYGVNTRTQLALKARLPP